MRVRLGGEGDPPWKHTEGSRAQGCVRHILVKLECERGDSFIARGEEVARAYIMKGLVGFV